ncbi:MAG: NADH-quinone oxidoreductase subunit N [Nitrospirae bacterium]|nr:NADH-quinone oxidoreductase subunit N [Nitrospirota bacterium]
MTLANLRPMAPELILIALGLVLLMLDLICRKKEMLAIVTLIGAILAFYFIKGSHGGLFDGMFIADLYSNFFKTVFIINLLLSTLISVKYLDTERALHGEYYALLVFATVGMMTMASAGNLIVLYLGLELMSLSIYVLCGFLRNNIKSTESAIKYFLLGAFSTAILLYAISLLYGSTGSTDFNKIANAVAVMGAGAALKPLLLFSVALFVTAVGFKIAAVPFHMWSPDVYEGAPTSVTAFMSVGPKAAGFAIIGKIFFVAIFGLHVEWVKLLIPISVATMITGNVLAISQTNIKRMLAYSSIAHAGYALLGILTADGDGLTAAMNYMLIYMFMNVGAFAVVIMLRTEDFAGDELKDYLGLAKTHPLAAFLMMIFMFSLTGIPPTAGFIGKFYIFTALIHSGQLKLAVAGVLISVISAFFYLRVVMYMYMKDPEVETPVSDSLYLKVALAISVVMVIVIGVFPGKFIEFAKASLILQ